MNYYKQRLILLPGFGEDDRIFRNLTSHFKQYDTLHIDYRDVLRKFSVKGISLQGFVNSMIQYYDIKDSDILIGHSLGGFLAHQIRQKVDCQNCLIASFTDPSKVKLPVNYKRLMKFLTMKGIFTSKLFKEVVCAGYSRKPSAIEIENVLTVFESYNKEDIYKLIKIVEPQKKNWSKLFVRKQIRRPSLIIHPKADWILKRPDEAHITVEGDHFALATNYKIVGGHLENWLLGMHQEWAHAKELDLEKQIFDEYERWVA